MTTHIKHIQQHYWRHPNIPYFELRSTDDSAISYKNHSHPEFSIGAVVKGTTRTKVNGQIHSVHAGELVLIEHDLVHSCNPLEGQKRSYHMMYLDIDWCQKIISGLYQKPVTHIQVSQLIIQHSRFFDHYLDIVSLLSEGNIPKIIKSIEQFCYEIFSRFCMITDIKTEDSKLIQYVKSRLLDNLTTPPLLEDLANELKVRQETIVRAFNHYLGISPKAFLNNARIEQAKLRLKSGMDIVETALSVGFSDQSHFHKTFVNYTSSTPRQYQKVNF